MFYQRQIFGGIASFYCICLGLFALYQNRHNKLNQSFAAYNFSLALWNISDHLIWFPPEIGIWHIRVFGIPGCFTIPFVLKFIYQLVEVDKKPVFNKVIRTFFILAIIFSFLHLTPWILKDAIYEPFQKELYIEIPGPLYAPFALFLLTGLVFVVIPLFRLLKENKGASRHQIGYVFLACSIGFVGLVFFFLGFVWKDLPFIYYSAEALVGVTFAYAIFKHNLIPTGLFIRRIALIAGIYSLIFLILMPLSAVVHKQINAQQLSFLHLTALFALVGGIFSLGPIVFSFMIRHLSLFQDQMKSHITHELKTPLTAIQSAQAILDDEVSKPNPDQTKMKDYMTIIDHNIDRLQKFVSDILDLNKMDQNQKKFKKEQVDLSEVAKVSITSFPKSQSRISLKNEGETTLNCYAEGIRQIFINLLSNAEKYGLEGPIQIKILGHADKVDVSVSDSGIGVRRDQLKNIFDPFFKGSTQTKFIRGSGLGLAIVKKWVDFHNGTVWALSEGEGKGTTISFSITK